MSKNTHSATEQLSALPVRKIFIAAFITQFCMGLEVLFRLNAASAIKHSFLDSTQPLTSAEMIGQILGVLFLGYAIANLVMSVVVDHIGLRRVHYLSLILYLVGTLTICVATPESDNAFLLLWGGSLIQGLAWGGIESALNPLIVTLYPQQKVSKLNLFYSSFALGMLVAAPLCLMVEALSLDWRVQLNLIWVPALVALFLISRVTYPPTERVAQGVSFKGMLNNTLARPAFYIFIFAMFISGATEIVPNSWIDLTLTKIVGVQGFMLVAFVYTVQIVVRLFAGVLNRYLGSSGIMFFGALFAFAGLTLFSKADTPQLGLIAALLYGIGTSVMWPTMLAGTSERFPGGGSLAIGITASAGMMSSYVLMPIFGRAFDHAKIQSAGGPAAFEALKEGTLAMDHVMSVASGSMFQMFAVLPCILALFFAGAWLYDRRNAKLKTVIGSQPDLS